MKWQPGQSHLQQLMQNAQQQAQAQWQRNLEGGWWLQQQQAKMNNLLLNNSLTRRTSLSSRIPLSTTNYGRASSPIRLTPASAPIPRLRIQPAVQPKPTAKIDNTWVDYNTTYKDQPGMRIHTKFSIEHLKGRVGTVAAYFYFADGTPLKDFNHNYRTQTGNICVACPFKPNYQNTLYNDFSLFMPYFELHMGPGNHALKFVTEVWDDQGRELAWSDWELFTLSSE